MLRFQTFRTWLQCCTTALFVAFAPTAQSASGEQIPIENFFKLSQFGSAAFNPSRTHIAFQREVEGRMNLLVMEAATRKITNVVGMDKADVEQFNWLNDDRLMYSITDRKVAPGYNYDVHGIYAIDRDGKNQFVLSEGMVSGTGVVGSGGARGLPTRAEFFRRVNSGDKNDFIAIEASTNPFRTTLYRINSRDGSRRLIDAGGLPNIIDWAFDSNDVPRAVVAALNTERAAFFVRDSATSPWRKVKEFDTFDAEAISPIDFDKDGQLYVTWRNGHDTASIYRFDFAKGQPEPEALVSIKDYDIGGGILMDKSRTVIGVRYEADQEGTYWIDPKWKRLQAAIDAALPGRVNNLSGNVDELVLVSTYSDVSPGRFYLYDVKANKLSLFGNPRPWIDEKLQARSDVIRYKARDGMTIPALLTLPRNADAKKLPLVVFPHGGPYVRGQDWRWQRERQFLASRGYAVLEPEFRGSTSHGWKLFQAGWKQWGLAMQDDLADGVVDLAAKGIVDKERVCIAGASYGGYATVFGLIKHPDVYKCGISWVGVTDIDLLFTVGWSDTAGIAESRYYQTALIADREKDKAQLQSTSAIAQAARLKRPLILAYGKEDVRVPFTHGRLLRDALAGHNKDVDYIEYGGERHGWRTLENNVDFWTRSEKFLARNIGK